MRFILFFFVAFFATSLSFSQNTVEKVTIEKSIDSLYNRSSSWEFYKIIKKDRYLNLKKEILDTIAVYKLEIQKKSDLIKIKDDSLKNTKEVVDILSGDLKQTIASKNEINFLGISFSKSNYQLFVWSIILILGIALGYFIFQYKNSHLVTKSAQNELEELEEEFAAHKKKAMGKEQKLRRQLQDEINKQRGV